MQRVGREKESELSSAWFFSVHRSVCSHSLRLGTYRYKSARVYNWEMRDRVGGGRMGMPYRRGATEGRQRRIGGGELKSLLGGS